MNVYTIRSNAELVDILKTIEGLGGGTIELDPAGGPYQIDARGLGSQSTPVTITSVDPENPAVVDLIKLENASHVTISNLHVEGKEWGEPRSIWVAGSDNVTLTNNTMTGKADGFVSETGDATRGNPVGLFRDSTNITITDNTISHFGGGLGILEIDGLVIEGNEISYIQGDGIRGAGIQNASISDNHFHDFYGSTQSINHSDMIQLWGTNALTVTSNVTISGNVLDTGSGALSQGIFIRNEEFGRGEDPVNGYFQNITITDNVVHNGAPHGITVSDIDGLVIQSNTLLLNEASYMYDATGKLIVPTEPRYMITNSLDITAEDNLGSKFLGQISAENNTTLVYNNPADEMYVGKHIVNLSGVGDTDLRDLQIRFDSPLWEQTGSALTSLSANDLGLVLASTKVAGNALEMEFDAGYGDVPPGSSIEWRFGDGTVLTGETVNHVFTEPGRHKVQLVIEDSNGKLSALTRWFDIDDPYLFTFDFSNGGKDGSDYAVTPNIKGTDEQAFVVTPEDKGFHLTSGTGFSIGHENKQLNGLGAFEIDLRFRQDHADGEGGLLGIHTVFKLDIQPDGALSFWLKTSDGNIRITSEPGVMNDRNWHDIGVRYDGSEISLTLDGDTVATGAATGTTNGALTSGLQLGRPWGENAEGVFEFVSMNLPFDASAPSTGAVAPLAPLLGDSNDTNASSDSTSLEETVIAPQDETVIAPQDETVTAPQDETVTAPQDETVTAPQDETAPTSNDDAVLLSPTSNTLLDIDFSDNGKDASDYNSQVLDRTEGQGFVAGLEGAGFQIGDKSNFEIEKTNSHLYGLDAFDIAFDFRKDAADGHGGLLNQHTILDLNLRADGGLTLRLKTDRDDVVLDTRKGMLSDTDWHHINLRYDDAKGEASILVDGKSAATAALTGTTADASYWSMIIGDPWHAAAPGVVDNLQITRPDPDTQSNKGGKGPDKKVAVLFEDPEIEGSVNEVPQLHGKAHNNGGDWDQARLEFGKTLDDTYMSDAIIPL